MADSANTNNWVIKSQPNHVKRDSSSKKHGRCNVTDGARDQHKFCVYSNDSNAVLNRTQHITSFVLHREVSNPPVLINKTLNFRPKCSKSIPVFIPKQLKNHTLWGGTYIPDIVEYLTWENCSVKNRIIYIIYA